MPFLSRFERNKPLSALSTFAIGGTADFFIEIHAIEEMSALIAYCHNTQLRYIVIGKGSNSLFHDRGFKGLVILNKIVFCELTYPLIHVGAGYSFSLLGTQTARQGWSGLEFASGIPGSVGGAIYMNAGANGVETCNSLVEVSLIDEKGGLIIAKKEEIEFSYRSSSFQTKKRLIVSAKFLLHPLEDARQKQLLILDYRKKTQPYSDPSIGCVFRNPKPESAGGLIEKAGLKGKRIGGAEVSTLHANFIVNKDNARASDVLELAELIRSTIKEKMGIDLEMEIRCIPYE